MNIIQLEEKCRQIREDIVKMINNAGSGHPGGSLSMVEIIVSLYYKIMNVDPNNPEDLHRDRFVLSKGHAAPVLYAVLADKGYFDKKLLKTLRKFKSPLQGHPDKKKLVGVDASTGSLGQGISIAVGMALGAKKISDEINVYVVLGDGELNEGQVWEAAMSASHFKLDNLTVIVDKNDLQLDGPCTSVMNMGNVVDKFKAFGFDTIEVDEGNNINQILAALEKEVTPGKPKCIVANTVKGKGVSFMENQVGWHGRALNDEELEVALQELGGC